MIADIDIWCAANHLIREYAEEAEIKAAQKADLMLDRGDLDGRRVFVRRFLVRLDQMVLRGYVERIGGGNGVRWRLASHQL